MAVQTDIPTGVLVETRQKTDQCRLATARTPDQGNTLTGGYVQGNILENVVQLVTIAEGHAFKFNVAVNPFRRVGARIVFRFLVHGSEDVVGSGNATLDLGMYGRYLANGLGHGCCGGNEGHKLAGTHFATDLRRQHGPHQCRDGNRHQHLDNRDADGLGGSHLQALLQVFLTDLAEAVAFIVLAAKGTDHPIATDGLGSRMGNIAHRPLDTFADSAEALTRVADHQGNQRPHGQEYKGQLPVGVNHKAQQAENGKPFPEGDGHGVGRGIRHLFNIVRDLRNQPAGSVLIEIARRQAQQTVEDLLAQGVNNLPPNVTDEILAHEGADTTKGKHPNNQ